MPSLKAEEVASLTRGTLIRGPVDVVITRIMPLDDAERGSATFVARRGLERDLACTEASVVVVGPPEASADIPAHAAVIVTAQPYVAFARLAQALAGQPSRVAGISRHADVSEQAHVHASASVGPFCVVGPDAHVGEGVVLYPGVHIEEGARVGAGSILYDHVVVRRSCVVGAGCVFHPGVVIGADGFGFAQEKTPAGQTVHLKIPQTGNVVIEDDVEIGAQSCVDRGTLGTTRVGRGTKIDNLVQIGHNAEIGPRCILVAQSGVAGSSRLAEEVMMGAQSGVAGHLSVEARSVVLAQAGVMRDVPADSRLAGSPAFEGGRFFRSIVRLRALDRLFARVRALERRRSKEDSP